MSSLQRILYVDDEADILAIVEFALQDVSHFEVQLCQSGKQALEQAATFRPDLILLDVMMPDMDGPATLRALKQDPGLQDIPVIFMTAKVQTDEVEQYQQLGVIGVVTKPFDPMTLADDVQAIWTRQHG